MILRTRTLAVVVWRVLRRDVHDLEYDPRVQFRWHLVMTIIWFTSMAVFTLAWFVTLGFGSGFTSPSMWLLFFTLWVSLYANFATDYDAMSASLAAYTAADIKNGAAPDETTRGPSTRTVAPGPRGSTPTT